MNDMQPSSQAQQPPADRSNSFVKGLRWLQLAAVFSIAHGLVVWWSISNTSVGFWTMEGGSRTLVELIADALTVILNFPSFIVCRMLGLPPFGFTLPGFLVANSCLWGVVLALIYVAAKRIVGRSGVKNDPGNDPGCS